MIVLKSLPVLIIFQMIKLSHFVPIDRDTFPRLVKPLKQIVAVPRDLNTNVLVKASEKVRDRFLNPDEFMLIDEESDPFIAVDNRPVSCSDNNIQRCEDRSTPQAPLKEISRSLDQFRINHKSDVFVFLRIIMDLLLKLDHLDFSQFIEVMWHFTKKCNCGIDIKPMRFLAVMASVRQDLRNGIEFNEQLYRMWNCHNMVTNGNQPKIYGRQKLWRNGEFYYRGNEPSLWPQTERGGRMTNRYAGKYYRSLVHPVSVDGQKRLPGTYKFPNISAKNQETKENPPEITPIPSNSSLFPRSVPTDMQTTTIEPNDTTDYPVFTSTLVPPTTTVSTIYTILDIEKVPRDDPVTFFKSSKRTEPKKSKPMLWYVGRDLIDYQENELGEKFILDEDDYWEDQMDKKGKDFLLKWKKHQG